ncbi:hypothetical protein TTHERM_001013369 (macronuclear) [Tetrahymena thermophila SB210]|uniref:Transmembrane protein n=1 Tax=Tetrahymena thermophila (strain SB210) TaxID=312017 RepID=W7XBJ2_TETTS|nr:hypothetical protein TTHERM_001013369 [Tetrahymena thermophila SB210]EWS76755.1 hypothetical protein TTHERM_001013369 [Tetrahymena thermophila SB210]|eukprot:XP_012650717.1 hypothetical protein TTHERM_001013369 [Tetrahymena thermophila SB210]
MKISLFFAIIFTLASKIRAECSRGKIFNLVQQQCLPCSSSCQDCFSTSQDSCISCPQNYYKSNLNSSTCVQNCEVGEIKADNQQCIKCQIVGCIKCDSKQNCLQCSPNLYFDKVNNECSLKPKICQSEQDFIQEPFTKQQCINSCPSSYYPNQKTQICEKISQCIQINDTPPLLNQKVLQLNSLYQDYYLIRANSCNFALVDQNFQIIYIEILQNMPDFELKYMNTGEEAQQKSFILEEYGGCLANNSIKVMNFITKQIVFEQTDLDQDYFLQYIDYQNKVVFLNQKTICSIAWFDLIQQKFTTFGCDQTPIKGVFQIYILNKTNYYIQISVDSYQVAILQEDRSLQFLETQFQISGYLIITLDTYQEVIQNPSDYYFSLYYFVILNDDQILYLTQNELGETILYLIDFLTNNISEIYNFGTNPQPNFYYVNNYYTPLVAFNDIIYFQLFDNDCQPFSISQKNFVYKSITMQFSVFNYPYFNYQKTGEIFIFYQSLIQVYSFDLSQSDQYNLGINYPQAINGQQIQVFNDRYVFYYDQSYFYRFDMELKQFTIINAKSDASLYGKTEIQFYFLDENLQYIKKSDNIIDTNNMVIIMSQLEDSYLLGSIDNDDNTKIHSFSSQDGVFWINNLFNNPFSVYNFTQNQVIQDINLQNNKIAVYDNFTQNLIIYDVIKTNNELVVIKLNFTFDLSIVIVDWNLVSFIWVKENVFYLQNTQNQPQTSKIIELESKIVKYYYCSNQQTLVALTSRKMVYSINVFAKTYEWLEYNFQAFQISFFVQCEDNQIVFYYPYVQIFDLVSVERLGYFQDNLYDKGMILNIDNYKILIGLTGTLKQVNIINIPGKQQLFLYECVGQFAKNAVYYYQEQTSLIVVDSSPTIYLFNYLTMNVTNIRIDVNNIQGVLMDKNKNIAFLYSNQFILTFQFPSILSKYIVVVDDRLDLHIYNCI